MRHILLAISLTLPTASSTQAGNLGRLFFTPEQRAQLEQECVRNATAGDGLHSSVLAVSGIVQKRGGTRTVWINGTAHDSGYGGEPSAEAVTVPGKSPPIKVKVGQKLLLNNAMSRSSHASTE